MQSQSVFRDIDVSTVAKIYKPSHIGGLHIRKALNPNFQELLREEVINLRSRLVIVNESKSIVKESYSRFHYQPTNGSDAQKFPYCSELARTYTSSIYNVVATQIGFPTEEVINSVSIHMYPKGTGGVTYHRDYKIDRNLVGIVSVENSANFSLARSREGKEEFSFTVEAGDLVLLRSTVWPQKKRFTFWPFKKDPDLRPFHKVESLDQDRYSIILRTVYIDKKIENG